MMLIIILSMSRNLFFSLTHLHGRFSFALSLTRTLRCRSTSIDKVWWRKALLVTFFCTDWNYIFLSLIHDYENISDLCGLKLMLTHHLIIIASRMKFYSNLYRFLRNHQFFIHLDKFSIKNPHTEYLFIIKYHINVCVAKDAGI